MDIDFKISNHAADRFAERFGRRFSILSLLEGSIPFGGQKGSEYLLLNTEHEIVFPIITSDSGHHVVKTVLTLQQAKANLSVVHDISFNLDFSKYEEERKNNEEEIINKLKFLAREYLSNLPTEHRSCPGPHLAKVFKKKIKKKLLASNAQIDKFFIGEMARIIRESDWSCLHSKSNWSNIEELMATIK